MVTVAMPPTKKMKTDARSVIASILLTSAILFGCSGQPPGNIGLDDGRLSPCSGKPNCVNGNSPEGVGSYFFNFNCNADSQTVGVNLLQAQMLPSIAYNINKTQTIGASLAIGIQ